MEKYRVTLTADERHALEKLVAVGRAAARKLPHARILWLADTSHELAYRDDQSVLALGTSLRRVERLRNRFVTEGIDTAIHPKPQPPRPDQINIKGDIAQSLGRLAGRDPPQGRCHWTLQLLADELVVLGLVETISTETVRQALKKMIFARGSLKRGVSPRMPMPTSSGAWKMACKRIRGPLSRVIPWSVATTPVSNCLVRCGRLNGPRQASPRGWTTSRTGKGAAISV